MDAKPSQIAASPYTWPHDGPISREHTALVLIDMQRDCTLPHSHRPL